MWGWSRRTGGQALKGGGRQQAALKTRAKRAQATGEIHVLFTEDGLGLRMAAELGCNAFKLERLAHKPTPQRGPRHLFVQVKVILPVVHGSMRGSGASSRPWTAVSNGLTSGAEQWT